MGKILCFLGKHKFKKVGQLGSEQSLFRRDLLECEHCGEEDMTEVY